MIGLSGFARGKTNAWRWSAGRHEHERLERFQLYSCNGTGQRSDGFRWMTERSGNPQSSRCLDVPGAMGRRTARSCRSTTATAPPHRSGIPLVSGGLLNPRVRAVSRRPRRELDRQHGPPAATTATGPPRRSGLPRSEPPNAAFPCRDIRENAVRVSVKPRGSGYDAAQSRPVGKRVTRWEVFSGAVDAAPRCPSGQSPGPLSPASPSSGRSSPSPAAADETTVSVDTLRTGWDQNEPGPGALGRVGLRLRPAVLDRRQRPGLRPADRRRAAPSSR